MSTNYYCVDPSNPESDKDGVSQEACAIKCPASYLSPDGQTVPSNKKCMQGVATGNSDVIVPKLDKALVVPHPLHYTDGSGAVSKTDCDANNNLHYVSGLGCFSPEDQCLQGDGWQIGDPKATIDSSNPATCPKGSYGFQGMYENVPTCFATDKYDGTKICPDDY